MQGAKHGTRHGNNDDYLCMIDDCTHQAKLCTTLKHYTLIEQIQTNV